MQISISEKMAEELKAWAEDEKAFWPEDTQFQGELSDLLTQLDPASTKPERKAD